MVDPKENLVPEAMWRIVEPGVSNNQQDSGGGLVVLSERHVSGPHITLERESATLRWTIRCGIDGVFTHTAFASTKDEAAAKYSEMKRDLVAIVEASPSTPCYERIRLFTDVY
ncbi:MAG TPA: hypothetical protein PLN52_25770 [Opitutaceae bacterium]|nr:hypothetical protein [Opitutaceae bacterium]